MFCPSSHFFIAPFAVLSMEDPNADLLLIWKQLRWHSSRNKRKTSGIAQDQRWRQNMISLFCCTHAAWSLKWRFFVLKETKYIDIITNFVGNYAMFRWLKFWGYARPIHLTWTKSKVVRLSALVTGRLYPPGNISCTYFCHSVSRLLGHNGPEGLNERIPVTPSRTETETLRLVPHCLKQLRHRIQEQPVLCMKTNTHFLSNLAHFFLERKMFQTNILEKIKHTFHVQ